MSESHGFAPSSEPPPIGLFGESPPSAIVGELRELIAKAHREAWSLVPGPQLLIDAEALLGLTDQLDVLRAQVIAALDLSGEAAALGHRSCGAMLKRRNPGRHAPRVGRDVHLGAKLLHMPLVAAAMERGQITAEHARLLATCLDRRFDGRFAESEEMLVGWAIDLSWAGFSRVISRWKEAADTAEPDLRDQKDLDAREVQLSRSFNERGMLSGTLTPHARQVFGSELDRLTDELWAADWAEAAERLGDGNVTNDQLGRTAAQRRHDALLLMAERSRGADGRLADPVVYVHCTVGEFEQALSEATACAPAASTTASTAASTTASVGRDEGDDGLLREYEDHTPISRRMLARLAVRAVVKRVVWDPAQRIIDISPGARLFSRRQREVLAVRDRVCVCGCGLSARRCEADHVMEVRDGGLTIVDNAAPRCGRSHKLKTNARNRRGSPPLG